MIGIYVDYLQTPAEVPEGMSEWIVVNSFEKFKEVMRDLGQIPGILSLGYQLDERAWEWTLNPDSEGKKVPYAEMETTVNCLAFLRAICQKNELTFKEVWIHTPHPQGEFDLRNMLAAIYKEQGIPPKYKILQVDIGDNFAESENYKTFLTIKEKYEYTDGV